MRLLLTINWLDFIILHLFPLVAVICSMWAMNINAKEEYEKEKRIKEIEEIINEWNKIKEMKGQGKLERIIEQANEEMLQEYEKAINEYEIKKRRKY